MCEDVSSKPLNESRSGRDTAKVTDAASGRGLPVMIMNDGLMILAEEVQTTDSPTQSPRKPKGPRVGWDINHRYSCSCPWLWIAGNREQLSAIMKRTVRLGPAGAPLGASMWARRQLPIP